MQSISAGSFEWKWGNFQLEYPSKTEESAIRKYTRLREPEFSGTYKLQAPDGKRYTTRVFNEDGIYEITMLSESEKGKEFRSYVRKLLKSLRKGETKIVSMTDYQKMMAETRQANIHIQRARLLKQIAEQYDGTYKQAIEFYVQEEYLEKAVTQEKNGGRIETRTAYASRDIVWLDDRKEWANLSCIGAIHTQFEKNGHKSSNWHYYISSAPLNAKELLHHARLEWGVESMHWLLDVHFDEDKTRVWDMEM